MLLTIIGLALLFIILVNVVLFCLETEAVGIIISIIGILIFLSGGHLYGVIVVIVGICLYNHAKETNEKAEKERSKKYFQQEMYKLVEQCWNSQTYDFNWKLWFDNKDAIFYGDSSLELKKTAQAELQSLGKAQINLLNMYLDLMLMCGKVTNDNLIDSSHYFRNTDQYEKLMWEFSYISFCLSKHFWESDVFVSFLLTASL